MTWESVQQVLRIILYSGGSYIFGQGFADGDQYQQFIGGILAVGSFAWWLFWEYKRPKV